MIKNKSNTKEFKYEKIQIDIIVKSKKELYTPRDKLI